MLRSSGEGVLLALRSSLFVIITASEELSAIVLAQMIAL